MQDFYPPPGRGGCLWINKPARTQQTSPLALAGALVTAPAAGLVEVGVLVRFSAALVRFSTPSSQPDCFRQLEYT